MAKRCSFPGDGVTIRFGSERGIDLDPCLYEEVETVAHCTVHLLRCVRCGHRELEWEKEKPQNALTWHNVKTELPQKSGDYVVAVVMDDCGCAWTDVCAYRAPDKCWKLPGEGRVVRWIPLPKVPDDIWEE